MYLKKRIELISLIGSFFSSYIKGDLLEKEHHQFERTLQQAENKNGWFVKEQLLGALSKWANLLNVDNLTKWVSPYDFDDKKAQYSKVVAIIMAGNIPLVGLHDLISVFLSGNKALIKMSSHDDVLLSYLIHHVLAKKDENILRWIAFSDSRLQNFDAVIATGSNNTSRYFEYYFGKVPHIIRKNRTSVAVILGKESKEELQNLGRDIFTYYGLGCRSVTKVFVPRGYSLDFFFESIYDFGEIINNHKYRNNYDYHKAIYLMNREKFLDNNFLLVKEDQSYYSPIGVLFYEYYDHINDLKNKLLEDKEKLQCIVGDFDMEGIIPFGKTQDPLLEDYADKVNTLSFLKNIS